MVKNIVKSMLVIAAMVGMVGVIQSNKANATVPILSNVEICHSRQPQGSNGQGQGAQNNPYGPSSQTVSVSSIFGNNGHDNHDGPVFNGTGQDYWGDIIPPFFYWTHGQHPQLKFYAGKNWTAAGKAIYNNDCQFTPMGVSSYELDCEEITLNEPTGVKPYGGTAQYYIDGVAAALGSHDVTAGSHTITLKVNGVLVDTDVVNVEECEEEVKPADVNVSVVCDPLTNLFTFTIKNDGEATAEVMFNAETFDLDGGESTTRDLAGGQTLTLKVDGVIYETEGGEKYDNKVFVSCQGQGSTEVPVTPAGGQGSVVSLPNTGSAGAQIASLIALLATVGTAIGGYVLRNRGVSSL